MDDLQSSALPLGEGAGDFGIVSMLLSGVNQTKFNDFWFIQIRHRPAAVVSPLPLALLDSQVAKYRIILILLENGGTASFLAPFGVSFFAR